MQGNSSDWINAIQEEINSLNKNETWILVDRLLSCRFKDSSSDPCFFFKKDIILMFHVDDGLVIRITDGEYFLGIHLNYVNGVITLNQSSFIERLLTKLDLTDCNPFSLPIRQGWSAANSTELGGDNYFREMVGSLLYLTLSTRPDLSFAVNVACRAQDKPTIAHLNLVKRIFRYIKGTKLERL